MTRSMARNPALIIGLVLAAAVGAVALVSLVWTPYDPLKMAIVERLRPPGAGHPFGTDQFGRDVASLLMRGAANSLVIGFAAVGAGLSVGVGLGTLAAARAGTLLDDIVMRAMDFTFAFPAVLTAIMLIELIGPGTGDAILAIAIFNVPVFARLSRASALSVWTTDYAAAARAAGKTRTEITFSHVLPNIAGVIVVQASVQFALAILAEAGLSYLGVGTQPPNPSWGRMLNDAQTFLKVQPLLAVFPGLAIAVTVFAFNALGDGLSHLIDPKQRNDDR
ncbi:MAG: ABC transporter permease [Ancalomicrobiaceae bacterium]|nr:ABC transporter permease [Ancalomicrobiaceae bacterium]